MTRPILTAQAMRDAEQTAIDSGTPVEGLMERAGAALAEAIWRFSGSRGALFLCGPGNNGGDGYVAARHLAERGVEVQVAALAEPSSDAAKRAKEKYGGPVVSLTAAQSAPVLVDCLFGTGLSRGLDEEAHSMLASFSDSAHLRVACDLPSGVSTDDGSVLSSVPDYDLTVTFAALKPAHRLVPAMHRMGRLVLADIGIDATGSDWFEIARPDLPPLDPRGHKYSRGLVHALAGEMPGAIALSAKAAARAGAGYVRVSTMKAIDNLPSAVVQTGAAQVNDGRIGCLLVGPGLGDNPQVLTLALTGGRPVVIDADALLHVGDPERLDGHDAILTPHDGEFEKLFGAIDGSKPDRALIAAQRSQSIVVCKGPDTLVASPDGRLGFAPPAPAHLATAGTGDVLAGIIAALRARGMESFDAACAAVWIQARAAEAAGPAMIADDLVDALPDVLA